MPTSPKQARAGQITLNVLIAFIIAGGIVLRLVMFFQNRNLIIDEANIVRNLSERSFGELVQPLKYEQYAPPVFLWIEKLFSIIFNYGEKAMRLYPLLCGIGVLFLFYKVALKLVRKEAIWMPLALLSFVFIFVKYSAEIKQYMPDTFIALLLVWLALIWDMRTMRKGRFVLLWIIAGTIAIWASMPSVFTLCGVGAYYAWTAWREKRYKDLGLLALIGAVWVAQFGLYYFTILKAQIGSDYLQNYHRDYFLYATPANSEEWLHNWHRVEEILVQIGGKSTVAVTFHLLLLVAGGMALLWKHTSRFMLIALPIGLVLIAAALKQFSLIERVVLFMMPLCLLLIAVGFAAAWRLGWPVRIVLIIVSCFNIYSYNNSDLLFHKFRFHEITEGFAYLKERGANGEHLYVHDANVPTYIYYTTLHPDKAKWQSLSGAHKLTWEDDYTQLTKNVRDTVYFLYTGGFGDDEKNKRTHQIEVNMKQVAIFDKDYCHVYVYAPKTAQDMAPAGSGTTPN